MLLGKPALYALTCCPHFRNKKKAHTGIQNVHMIASLILQDSNKYLTKSEKYHFYLNYPPRLPISLVPYNHQTYKGQRKQSSLSLRSYDCSSPVKSHLGLFWSVQSTSSSSTSLYGSRMEHKSDPLYKVQFFACAAGRSERSRNDYLIEGSSTK